MFERFTAAARTAVIMAQEHARRTQADHIGAEHLLLAVVADAGEIPARVLARIGVSPDALAAEVDARGPLDAEALGSLGIDLAEVRRRAEATFGPGALDRLRRQRPGLFRHRSAGGHLPFTREAKASLELSLRAAVAEQHRHLGPEHVLLGLLATEEGTALAVLQSAGVRQSRVELERLVLAELDRAA